MRRAVAIIIGGVAILCLLYKDVFAAAPVLPTGQDLEAQAERFSAESAQGRRSVKETKNLLSNLERKIKGCWRLKPVLS